MALALFGKLPAHGDFVRRGDPALALRLEAWLDAEIDRRVAATGAVPEPEACWFAAGDDLAGALVGSRDSVGRAFPIATAIGGVGDPERIAVELVEARDAGDDADALHARLLALVTDRAAPARRSDVEVWQAAGHGDGWPDEAAVSRLRETIVDARL